ncbi:MAG: WD40 repeat domain-containing protein, partial [Polyangia bacterium]|nr:WD40 repeat domain-containing protein [Polyangia bacterium]
VTYLGKIFHWDGLAWTQQASGTSAGLYAIRGFSGTDVFAAGVNGQILHYDGVRWALLRSYTSEHQFGIALVPGENAYFVGSAGSIGRLRYAGTL